ncbi:MAG: alpha/beta hydrolase family protein [Kiritimatiellia bacterium]
MKWKTTPIKTSWDDLLRGVRSPADWEKKRKVVKKRFLELLRDEAAPRPPRDRKLKVEREWEGGGFRIRYISYQVEEDERAHAYVAVPDAPVPKGGFPAVICLHGTTNWGARRTLGLPPEHGDPDYNKGMFGMDSARQLVRRGYVTISPEHFCAGKRLPAEGRFETAPFYRRHPGWSAVGKYMYDSRIACSVLAAHPEVNPRRIGVTGHSLGGQGSIWLTAYDDRIRCSVPSCAASTFRENPEPLHWSRDRWYIYFPQLRKDFLAGRKVQCDFHEMMALIAPRPLLEFFALNDGYPSSQQHRAMLHLKVHELYRLLGAEQAHAFLVFGDGHSFPDLSRACMLSWMDRWLKHGGAPLGGWDSSLTPGG